MALPELEAKRVDAELKRFSERVPPHVRRELWYKSLVRGNVVTLLECRPFYADASQSTEHPIARFRFDATSVRWSLHWSDRNGRWHKYEGFESVRHFAKLIAEVERDPTGIFFG
jgi:hypothetical protein